MPVIRAHRAAAAGAGEHPAGAPVPVDLLGRHRAAADERRRPDAARALARGARARAARARASSASAARTSAARSRSTTSTATLQLLDDLAAAAAGPRARSCASPPPPRGRSAPMRPPPIPAAELRPQGRRHSPERDAPVGPPPLRRLERVLRAVPRRVDDLQLRVLLARRVDASRRRSARSSSSCARSSRCSRASACSTSAAAGAASRSTPRASTACRSPASRCRSRRPSSPAGASPRRAWTTWSTSACMDYRELSGEPFDAIASIGMVEHVGANRIDEYARTLARLLRPGGRLLNHGIARLRHGDPEAGPFSERYVFPDAAPLHLSRIQLAIERRGPRDRPRRGLPRGLRRDAAALDAPARGPDRRGRARSRARSACASGGSTCAPPAVASRPASCRCTRFAAQSRISAR